MGEGVAKTASTSIDTSDYYSAKTIFRKSTTKKRRARRKGRKNLRALRFFVVDFHSETILAHSCPLWTAPSIVAGNPVAVQSPARKKLSNRVRLEGRSFAVPTVCEIVASYSLTTKAWNGRNPRADGKNRLISPSASAINSSFGLVAASCAPLITRARCWRPPLSGSTPCPPL